MRVAISEVVLENRSTGTRQRDLNLLPALLRQLQSGGHEALVYIASDLSTEVAELLAGDPPLAEVIRAPFGAQPTSKRLVYGARYFRRQMYMRGIDLFDTNYFPLPPVGVPTVLTVNDVRFVHFPETYTRSRLAYLRFMVPLALRQATRVVAISADTRDDIINHFGVDATKIDVVPVAAAPTLAGTTKRACMPYRRVTICRPSTFSM